MYAVILLYQHNLLMDIDPAQIHCEEGSGGNHFTGNREILQNIFMFVPEKVPKLRSPEMMIRPTVTVSQVIS